MKSASVSISINDNSKLALNELKDKIAVALEEIGSKSEGYAKKKCPVDTGRLRNSITYETDVSEKSMTIGTDVEYGKYVELGTSRQAPKGFIGPSVRDHVSEYKAIVERNLKS